MYLLLFLLSIVVMRSFKLLKTGVAQRLCQTFPRLLASQVGGLQTSHNSHCLSENLITNVRITVIILFSEKRGQPKRPRRQNVKAGKGIGMLNFSQKTDILLVLEKISILDKVQNEYFRKRIRLKMSTFENKELSIFKYNTLHNISRHRVLF